MYATAQLLIKKPLLREFSNDPFDVEGFVGVRNGNVHVLRQLRPVASGFGFIVFSSAMGYGGSFRRKTGLGPGQRRGGRSWWTT